MAGGARFGAGGVQLRGLAVVHASMRSRSDNASSAAAPRPRSTRRGDAMHKRLLTLHSKKVMSGPLRRNASLPASRA
jgi:hypothetical protein